MEVALEVVQHAAHHATFDQGALVGVEAGEQPHRRRQELQRLIQRWVRWSARLQPTEAGGRRGRAILDRLRAARGEVEAPDQARSGRGRGLCGPGTAEPPVKVKPPTSGPGFVTVA